MTSHQIPDKRAGSRSKPLWIALIAAACLFGLAFVAIRVSQPREPSFEGRSLSSWLDDFSYDDTNLTSQAEIAVRRMGTNAIPFLLDILTYQESPGRKKLRQITEKLPMWLHFFARNSMQGVQAGKAMNALGPLAAPVFPVLTNLFYNGKTVTAGIALAGIGQNGVLFLVNALTNQDLNARFYGTSALALGNARSDFDIVIPVLVQALLSTNSSARSMAAMSLGSLRQMPEITVPALMENFDDPNGTLRAYVIISLGQFGTDAKRAVPLLLEARKDPDEDIRELAEQALQKISPESLK